MINNHNEISIMARKRYDTVLSSHFGMTFWLDDDNDFCYCPTFNDNKPDKDNWGYVCEWDTITSTDLDKLFHIHKECVLNKASIWA